MTDPAATGRRKQTECGSPPSAASTGGIAADYRMIERVAGMWACDVSLGPTATRGERAAQAPFPVRPPFGNAGLEARIATLDALALTGLFELQVV